MRKSAVALVLLLVLGAAAPALAAPRDLYLSFGDEGVVLTVIAIHATDGRRGRICLKNTLLCYSNNQME